MNAEQKHLLSLPRLPARLDMDQAAQLLGFRQGDVRILVAARLLTPLGRPSPNAPKFFAAVELEQLHADVQWLGRASDAVHRHWRRKNATDTGACTMARRPNGRRFRPELQRAGEPVPAEDSAASRTPARIPRPPHSQNECQDRVAG